MRYGLELEDVLAAAETWLCPHCHEEDHPEEVFSTVFSLRCSPAVYVATLPDVTSGLDTELAIEKL